MAPSSSSPSRNQKPIPPPSLPATPLNGAASPEAASPPPSTTPTITSSSSSMYFRDVDDIFTTLSSLTVSPSVFDSAAAAPSSSAATGRKSSGVRVLYTFASHPNETRLITIPTPPPPSSSRSSSSSSSSVSSQTTVIVQKLGIDKLKQLPKADVALRWTYLDDYVAICNGKRNLMDLVFARKLKVTGDRKVMRLVGKLMEMARAKKAEEEEEPGTVASSSKRKERGDGESVVATTTSERRLTGRRSSSNFLRRSSSKVLRRVTGKSSGRGSWVGEGSLADAPTSSRGNVDRRDSYPYTLQQMTNNDGTMVVKKSEDEEEDLVTEELDYLRQKADVLEDKCMRLEAQNIIGVVQYLDLVCRFVALGLSLGFYYWYCKGLFWMCGQLEHVPVQDLLQKLLQQQEGLLDGNALGRMVSAVLVHPVTIMVFKYMLATLPYLLATLPYLHHRHSHGLVHRRFEVFAVAFIIMIRIRLVRWRVNVFATTKNDDEETTSISRDGNNTDKQKVILNFGEGIDEDAIWDANYDISARFLYISILRLRGLWTKSAQYLASRADFVPTPYVRELSKLQDTAPETPWDTVQKILHKNGLGPDQLSHVDERPIASASIGQVHIATLRKTGEKVVVKVQHPHARRLLTDDFWSLKVLMKILAWLEPEYGFMEILMKEWANEARKELDFVEEMQNLVSANEAISTMTTPTPTPTKSTSAAPNERKKFPMTTTPTESCPESIPFHVEIPVPYPELSSRDVLVMSFCEGKRVDDMKALDEWGIKHEAVMNALAQAFAHMMYVCDIFNGDPHPGNIFIRPGLMAATTVTDEEEKKDDVVDKQSNGFTLVLLDWGLAKRLPEIKRIAFCQMAYAASTLDFGLMLDAFDTMGLKMKREDVAEDMEGVRFLLRDMAPREKARKRLKAKIQTDKDRRDSRKKGEKVPVESKAYPGEFFFFVRSNELLHGLGSRLKVEMTYLDVLQPYAERGLESSSIYRRDETIVNRIDSGGGSSVLDPTLQRTIEDVIRKLDEKGNIAGAQVCVLNSTGQTLATTSRGHMGGLKCKMPMRSDALILGFSCTKAITATIAHLMVEDGYLTYDEPLCDRVWTAFCPYETAPAELRDESSSLPLSVPEGVDVNERWAWKRSVTLRHVLTHSAGFWSALPSKMTIKTMSSCEECCSAFEYNPDKPEETLLPMSCPGDECMYHFLSFGWLVAGPLRGAYALRHGRNMNDVTFEEVYDAMLKPKLRAATIDAGFRPCGGGGGGVDEHPMALTDTEFNLSRLMQLRREAEAMGERPDDDDKDDEEGENKKKFKEIRESFRGKEFMFDSRIWNCQIAKGANVPAAGGRFSATGLANFYHQLGSGTILKRETLDVVTKVAIYEQGLQSLQGQTIMSSTNNTGGSSTTTNKEKGTEQEDQQQQQRSTFGLGYQLIKFESETEKEEEGGGCRNEEEEERPPSTFGHAGVGGSIGFHHRESGISVGIMLNKADADRDTAKCIVTAIATHLKW